MTGEDDLHSATVDILRQLGLPAGDAVAASGPQREQAKASNKAAPAKKRRENAKPVDLKGKATASKEMPQVKPQITAKKGTVGEKDVKQFRTTAPSSLPPWINSGQHVALSEGEDHWYDSLASLKDDSTPATVDAAAVMRIAESVSQRYSAEVAKHSKQVSNKDDADAKWIRDVIQSGTLSDKVAALAMQVQESPVHNLHALDLLVSMCCQKEQRVAQMAIEATKDLLMHSLLPDRALKGFRSHNFWAKDMNWKAAMLCYFESELMNRVEKFVSGLEAGSMVSAEYFKKMCIEASTDLLISKPEQEARLLALVVNKLGDPLPAVCQKALQSLKKIVTTHSAMSSIVVREVRILMSRPNIAVRALFTGVLFLSQLPLNGDAALASKLVECYVSLFQKATERGESGSRLLSALLTGINRAFPLLTETAPILAHVDSLFRIVHDAAFTASTQALVLISYVALGSQTNAKKRKEKKLAENNETDKSDSNLVNRFYRALYEKIFDGEITSRARNTLFLNLLYRSIKGDQSKERAMAFVKRLVITMTQCPSNIAAGLIYLISEIFRTRGDLSVMLSNSASNEISSLNEKNLLGNFDPEKREPSFAIAKDNTVSLWEASLFQHHFHPSVRAFSNNWLGPEHKINYNGDPVTDFSISTFLNRFSYKNPKTKNIEKVHRPLPKVEDPVNLEHLVGNSNDSITPDKAFFHKYFTTRGRLVTEGKSKDKSKQRSSADSDLDEEEIDDFANTLAENLMKSVEGNKLNRADIDDDLDFSSDSDASDDTSGYETGAVDAPEENEDVSNEDDSAAFDELDVDDIDDIPISDEEDLEQKPSSKKRKSKLEGGNTKRKRSNDAENVFASAEEFEVDMEDIVQTYDKKGKKSKQSNKEK